MSKKRIKVIEGEDEANEWLRDTDYKVIDIKCDYTFDKHTNWAVCYIIYESH